MRDRALDAFARLLLAIPNHRGCCNPPGWTACVGRRWDTADVEPWNLFNVWWSVGHWAIKRDMGL